MVDLPQRKVAERPTAGVRVRVVRAESGARTSLCEPGFAAHGREGYGVSKGGNCRVEGWVCLSRRGVQSVQLGEEEGRREKVR